MKKQKKPVANVKTIAQMIQARGEIENVYNQLHLMGTIIDALNNDPKPAAIEQFQKEVIASMVNVEKSQRRVRIILDNLYQKIQRK